MNSSTLNSKYLLILLAVILFILSGCAFGDPVQKTTEYLNSGNITEGVQYYNEHIEKADDQTREEIDKMISDYIDSLIVDWDISDEATEKSRDQLTAFLDINNDRLSASSKEKLDFINCELDGNKLLTKAENCYKQENYLEAMTYLEKADSEYSQYSLFEVLYTDSKLVLLQAIGHPSTISEYEIAIDTLNSYLTAVDDPDFKLALSKLENELT